jgi:hypothetical protein
MTAHATRIGDYAQAALERCARGVLGGMEPFRPHRSSRPGGAMGALLGVLTISALVLAWHFVRGRRGGALVDRRLDEELDASFPASDPPTVTQPGPNAR